MKLLKIACLVPEWKKRWRSTQFLIPLCAPEHLLEGETRQPRKLLLYVRKAARYTQEGTYVCLQLKVGRTFSSQKVLWRHYLFYNGYSFPSFWINLPSHTVDHTIDYAYLGKEQLWRAIKYRWHIFRLLFPLNPTKEPCRRAFHHFRIHKSTQLHKKATTFSREPTTHTFMLLQYNNSFQLPYNRVMLKKK